jgi:glycosyltransferase involved in cell wall biosynthesis
MNVVINIKASAVYSSDDQGTILNDFFLNLAGAHPEHFFFFIDEGDTHQYLTSKNCSIIASPPHAGNILLWRVWYAYQLPALLKKYKADIFINLDSICSLKTKVPQCLLVPDLMFKRYRAFYKKFTPTFFEKANMIITFSQAIKNEISRQYDKIDNEKVKVVYTGLNADSPPMDNNELTKGKYTEGKEYFLYVGEIIDANNLINLLKAFSFFKKRQKSNMQLIIATEKFPPNNPFIKSFKTYKYRNEVKLLADLQEEELIKITAGAYALLNISQQNGFYKKALQAMQYGVPVIANNTLMMNEVCGDAALFTEPQVFENIADKMMLLFKDENKRTELISGGKEQAAKFSAATTMHGLWQNIVKCAGITE